MKKEKEIKELRKALKLALREHDEWGKLVRELTEKLVKLDKK